MAKVNTKLYCTIMENDNVCLTSEVRLNDISGWSLAENILEFLIQLYEGDEYMSNSYIL